MITAEIKVIEEAGYTSAIEGLRLYRDISFERAEKVALNLAGKDNGHNKFLEHIELWIQVRVPRYIWQEMDTYRLSSKQSASTMNFKGYYDQADFEVPINSTVLNSINNTTDLVRKKQLLPECLLQTRIWKMSYKTLRNIFIQRRNHRMPHWHKFMEQVRKQVEHPELLP